MPKLKAFVPACDVSLSRQCYQVLGFTLASDGEGWPISISERWAFYGRTITTRRWLSTS